MNSAFLARARTRALFPLALLLASGGVVLATHEPAAEVKLPYTGHLQQGSAPVDGLASLTFTLYDAPSAGTELYTETADVLIVAGDFAHVIGAAGALSSADIEGRPLWLEVGVEGTALAGRQQLLSAARAVTAGRGHDLTLTTGRTVDAGWNEALHLASANNAAVTHGNLLLGFHDDNDAFYWRNVEQAGYAMTLTAGATASLAVAGEVTATSLATASLAVAGEVTAASLAGAFDQTGSGTKCLRIGNVQLAWGEFGAISHSAPSGALFFGYGAAVTFPCAFKTGTAPTLSISPDYGNDGVVSIVAGSGSLSATGFTPLAWASASGGSTGGSNRYLAVGEWR